MSYQSDPGGVFDTDAHRRTLAHLDTSTTYTLEDIHERMKPDVGTDLDEQEIENIVGDLEADGYATQTKDGWKQTKKGLDALNAPVPEEED